MTTLVIEVIKTYMPAIKGEADTATLEDWWRAYYSLFAEDYPDSSEIVFQKEFEPAPNEGIEEERYIIKEQLNVLVVLDVSGSMGAQIEGKRMIDIAKESIQNFVSELPKDANVGLRVYGFEGKRTGANKEKSCEST